MGSNFWQTCHSQWEWRVFRSTLQKQFTPLYSTLRAKMSTCIVMKTRKPSVFRSDMNVSSSTMRLMIFYHKMSSLSKGWAPFQTQISQVLCESLWNFLTNQLYTWIPPRVLCVTKMFVFQSYLSSPNPAVQRKSAWNECSLSVHWIFLLQSYTLILGLTRQFSRQNEWLFSHCLLIKWSFAAVFSTRPLIFVHGCKFTPPLDNNRGALLFAVKYQVIRSMYSQDILKIVIANDTRALS